MNLKSHMKKSRMTICYTNEEATMPIFVTLEPETNGRQMLNSHQIEEIRKQVLRNDVRDTLYSFVECWGYGTKDANKAEDVADDDTKLDAFIAELLKESPGVRPWSFTDVILMADWEFTADAYNQKCEEIIKENLWS